MLWFSTPRKRTGAPDQRLEAFPPQDPSDVDDLVAQTLEKSASLPFPTEQVAAELAAVSPYSATGGSAEANQPNQNPVKNPAGPASVGLIDDKVPANPISDRAELRPVGRRRCGGVALALGGGVARGWAHIGVLKAVDEFGLPISMIAGTSIGALVGGSYLSGNLDVLEEFARSLTKTNIVRYLDFSLRGSGLITGSRLARRMDEHMADVNIETLEKPFVAVATEISSGHEIWLGDGPIAPAIRASYALPGVFTPVTHGGRQLVDGALVNPVPVSVCRAYEPDMVIAVNLNAETFGRSTVIRPSHYEPIEDAIAHDANSQAASWFSFMQSKDRNVHRKNRLGVTSVMVQSFNIIQDRIARARLAGDPPDFTVRPKMQTIGLIEFHKADEAIDLGYKEMMSRLNDLREQGILDRLEIGS